MAQTRIDNFSQVIGQQSIKQLFLSALEKDRLAHAYLFHGPEGVGMDSMALSLAMTLYCDQHLPGGCQTCPSCGRILHMEQPGVTWVFPLPTQPKSLAFDKYQMIVRNKSLAYLENPYMPMEFAPELSSLPLISIDQIRQIKKETHLKMAGAQSRMIIISHADRMNVAASNSLLKLLEEPPPDTHLILTTSAPVRLLPTIRSRCQSVRFPLLPEDEIETALRERWEISAERSRFLARISGGTPQNALLRNSDAFEEKRNAAFSFLLAALQKDPFVRLTESDSLIAGFDKAAIKEIFEVLLMIVRDCFQIQTGSRGRVMNIDRLAILEKIADQWPHLDPADAIASIERAIDFIEKNVYLDLIVHETAQSLYGSQEASG